jgi:hypothetical protein
MSAEKLVRKYFQEKGFWTGGPAELSVKLDSAPMLGGKGESLIMPDLLVVGKSRTFWVEVKQKSRPQQVGKRGNQPEHGIEEKHFRHYRKVSRISDLDVYLLLLEGCTGELLFLDLGEHTPNKPLNRSSSQETTGAVMRNFPRHWFDALEYKNVVGAT